jgi:hypothetical protein
MILASLFKNSSSAPAKKIINICMHTTVGLLEFFFEISKQLKKCRYQITKLSVRSVSNYQFIVYKKTYQNWTLGI